MVNLVLLDCQTGDGRLSKYSCQHSNIIQWKHDVPPQENLSKRDFAFIRYEVFWNNSLHVKLSTDEVTFYINSNNCSVKRGVLLIVWTSRWTPSTGSMDLGINYAILARWLRVKCKNVVSHKYNKHFTQFLNKPLTIFYSPDPMWIMPEMVSCGVPWDWSTTKGPAMVFWVVPVIYIILTLMKSVMKCKKR